MPVNKKSVRRYRIIDSLLRSNTKYTITEIAAKVNEQLVLDGLPTVSDRMIYNDIEDMMDEYPVIIKKKKGKLFYEDKDDSIDKMPLTDQDKTVLEMALQTFSLYKGSPFFEKFDDVITRIMTGSVLRKIRNNDESNCIQLGEMVDDTGQKWLDVIYTSIIERKCIKLTYKSYNKESKILTVSPYLLKEYRNKWYLVAHEKDILDNVSTKIFKLFRIQKIEESSESYFIVETFNGDDFFKYSLGVFHRDDLKPIEVNLKFKHFLISLIMENKIHPSMEIVSKNNEELIVNFWVYNTIELKNLILSYGENVEVLSPTNLRNEISEAIKNMNSIYH
jgi:predicted DNA-binding transcriptional regulator YafY